MGGTLALASWPLRDAQGPGHPQGSSPQAPPPQYWEQAWDPALLPYVPVTLLRRTELSFKCLLISTTDRLCDLDLDLH